MAGDDAFVRILVMVSENSKACSLIWRSLRRHGVAHFVAEPIENRPGFHIEFSRAQRKSSCVRPPYVNEPIARRPAYRGGRSFTVRLRRSVAYDVRHCLSGLAAKRWFFRSRLRVLPSFFFILLFCVVTVPDTEPYQSSHKLASKQGATGAEI